MKNDDYNLLVAISSIDGDTFLIDRSWNIVRFRPPLSSYTGCTGGNDSMSNATVFDQIQAFTSGYFGDTNVFCFVYVLTHNDKIIIVHSVEINSQKTTNLLNVVNETLKTGNNRRFSHLFDVTFQFICIFFNLI